jgi:hypothetical protein
MGFQVRPAVQAREERFVGDAWLDLLGTVADLLNNDLFNFLPPLTHTNEIKSTEMTYSSTSCQAALWRPVLASRGRWPYLQRIHSASHARRSRIALSRCRVGSAGHPRSGVSLGPATHACVRLDVPNELASHVVPGTTPSTHTLVSAKSCAWIVFEGASADC